MSTRLRIVVLGLLTFAMLAAGSTTEAVAADVRHSGPHWVWFGPRPWHAAYGTYGITVESPTGTDVLDLGFGSTTCDAGATFAQSTANHFAALRRKYNTGAFRITKTGRIVHPAHTDSTYRRQQLNLRITSRGKQYTGVFFFDYGYQTTVSSGFSTVNYCYQRSVAMYAPVASFTASQKVLLRIFGSLAYSGPGACMGTKGTCDPDIK